jgi:hypothetical protein
MAQQPSNSTAAAVRVAAGGLHTHACNAAANNVCTMERSQIVRSNNFVVIRGIPAPKHQVWPTLLIVPTLMCAMSCTSLLFGLLSRPPVWDTAKLLVNMRHTTQTQLLETIILLFL